MVSFKTFFIVFTLFAILPYSVHTHDTTHCRHDKIKHDPKFIDVDEDFHRNSDSRNLGTAPNIRMYPYYNFLTDAPSSYQQYIQYELAPPVIAYFQATLSVRYPITNLLSVPRVQTTVCNVNTPEILFQGVKADYFIFYDSTYDSAESWIGDSTVCFMASGSNRPLVVNTKLNRALLLESQGDVLVHEKNTYLLIHEMTHTLGFSTSLYPYFLDNNGNRLTGHITSGQLDGATSLVLKLSELTSRLRSFFGCSSLAGAYMENSGSGATDGSHFERRHFVYEVMTSGLIYQQRVSEFTLSLLEGSGWYFANYNYAEPYYFGSGEGCGFLFDSASVVNSNYGEFCNNQYRGCSFEGRGGGVCQDDVRSDGVRYYYADENYDCEGQNTANYARFPNLQVFGRNAGSKCFSGTLSSAEYVPSPSSFCFKYACESSGQETIVSVHVGSEIIQCREQGQVQIQGYQGTIDCPDPQYFCSTIGKTFCPRNCMGRGECVNGQCLCYKGFQGTDCALNI